MSIPKHVEEKHWSDIHTVLVALGFYAKKGRSEKRIMTALKKHGHDGFDVVNCQCCRTERKTKRELHKQSYVRRGNKATRSHNKPSR